MSHLPLAYQEGPEVDKLLRLRPTSRIRWGLGRIRRILDGLGSPHESFRTLHVGGTNCKGSVSAMAASILARSGCRTGLYTSPHLIEFRERVRLDGVPIPRPLVEECAAEIAPLAERERASFFEATTALAFLALARAGAEVVVTEVGLGGRLDATNVVQPDACAITNVAYDHAQYLGNNLPDIAREKAGIIKSGTPAVVGTLPERLLELFSERAEAVGAPLYVLGRDAAIEDVQVGDELTRFTYRSSRHPAGLRLRTPLLGAHQATNASVALLMLEQGHPPLDTAVIEAGLAEVDWPGRFQLYRRGATQWVFDVAHNAAGAQALAATLHEIALPRPLVLLAAILGDKPWREMLDPLLSAATGAIFSVAPSSPVDRRWDPAAARDAVRGHRVDVEPDFELALARASEMWHGGTVVVAGSCYTVGDALLRVGGRAAAPSDASNVWLQAG